MDILVNVEGAIDELEARVKKIVDSTASSAVTYGDYLTTEQTRDYIGGISTNTLNKMRRRGLKRIKIDGLCLYKKSDICEFLDENRY
ncbi:helix-turn-helix domain-containing protein [Enterococcus sp. DIV0187]|uniref:helix-turn-helix domain-containing protein n=1 Tax=Enterococcus sp. DIV0187 TaxID=2774644 RepID=UPI003F248645